MPDRTAPYIVECEAGKLALCTCGKSSTMPKCDGAHQGTDDRPEILEIECAKTLAICGCGQTGNAPYCDGSHSRA